MKCILTLLSLLTHLKLALSYLNSIIVGNCTLRAPRMKNTANLMTNTDERAYYYYSETEARCLGPGTQFRFDLARWEIDLILFVFTVDKQIGGEEQAINMFTGK